MVARPEVIFDVNLSVPENVAFRYGESNLFPDFYLYW